jgi:hypothetical protein
MTSRSKAKANRINAKASTGPKSVHGRARAARNARTHGLNAPVLSDLVLAEEAKSLALEITKTITEEHFELAVQVAEAEIDLRRIRRIRRIRQAYLGHTRMDPTKAVMLIDRYEKRARARRRSAILALQLARRQAKLAAVSQPPRRP